MQASIQDDGLECKARSKWDFICFGRAMHCRSIENSVSPIHRWSRRWKSNYCPLDRQLNRALRFQLQSYVAIAHPFQFHFKANYATFNSGIIDRQMPCGISHAVHAPIHSSNESQLPHGHFSLAWNWALHCPYMKGTQLQLTSYDLRPYAARFSLT